MHPRNLTILLADSNNLMREALAQQLLVGGYGRVLQARDGPTALRLMQAEQVHLIACDMDLPGQNALAVLEAMRAVPRLADIPLVLLAGELNRQTAAKAIQLKIAGLLIKPFPTKMLIDRMTRALTRGPEAEAREAEDERATILVVDDTPDNLQLIAGLFREEFKVKLAPNGQRALAICQAETPPDLVLLDVMMPDMDGFEVAQRLRSHYATERTPIIFVTAMTDERARAKGLNLGAIDYVFKPIDPELLHLRVRNLMHYVIYRKQLQTSADQMLEINRLRHLLQKYESGAAPAAL